MLKSVALRTAVWFTCGCAAVAIFGGCENDQQKADRAAEKKVEEAEQSHIGASSLQLLDAVQSQYDAVADESGLSPQMQTILRGREAQVRLERATIMLGELHDKESALMIAINDLQQLGLQLAGIESSLQALQAYDPSTQIRDLDARRAEISGDSGKTTWKPRAGDPAVDEMPTLKAIDDHLTAINTAMEQNTARAKQLAQFSLSRQEQADAYDRRAEGEADAPQRRDSDEAAAMRRDAAIADAQRDTLSARLADLKADQAEALEKKAAIQATLTAIENQIQTLQTNWTIVQQQIAAQKQLEQGLISGGGSDVTSAASRPSGDNIADRVKQVQTMLGDVAAQRKAESDELEKCAEEFKAAAAAAGQLRTTLLEQTNSQRSSVDAPVWNQQLETLHPAYFDLQQAAAIQDRASVEAGGASIDYMLHQVLDGYQSSAAATTRPLPGLEADLANRSADVPGLTALLDPQRTGLDSGSILAGLQAPSDATLAQEKESVDDLYKSALDLYEMRYGVDTGPMAQERQNIALMGESVANRQWASFATMIGDDKTADARMQDANNEESQVDPAFRAAASIGAAPNAANAQLPATNPSESAAGADQTMGAETGGESATGGGGATGAGAANGAGAAAGGATGAAAPPH